MAVCQNLVPLVNIKIAGKWMFIPLKMVLIGIDPYPHATFSSCSSLCRPKRERIICEAHGWKFRGFQPSSQLFLAKLPWRPLPVASCGNLPASLSATLRSPSGRRCPERRILDFSGWTPHGISIDFNDMGISVCFSNSSLVSGIFLRFFWDLTLSLQSPRSPTQKKNTPKRYHILVIRGWMKTLAIRSDVDFRFLGFRVLIQGLGF